MSEVRSKVDWEKLLQRADEGSVTCQYDVGCYYDDGLNFDGIQIVEKDRAKAFHWFQKSCDGGNLQGTVRVADFLSEGIHCERDVSKAILLYRNAISQGCPTAAFNLGATYRDAGQFVLAFEYYALSETMHKTDGSLPMALCYLYGVGTEKNIKRCVEILNNISGHVVTCCGYDVDEANYYLGKLHLAGTGVVRSIERARHYLNLANTDNDHRSANELLCVIGRTDQTTGDQT
jgi:uncharacterized protein